MRKRLILWGMAGLSLAGCNGSLNLSDSPSQDASPVALVKEPNTDVRTTLRLVQGGNEFAIGDSIEEMDQIFVEPRASFEFKDLPRGFAPPYTAKGWQSAREGVGAIMYDGKVVAVMHQYTRSSYAEFNRIVDDTTRANSGATPTVIKGDHVEYYFWEKLPQRLMVMGLITQHDGWHITEALGDDTVMDAIGANPRQAEKDKLQVDTKFATPKS